MGEHVIGTTSDIPEGEARRFEVNGHEIAVANLGGGEFRAIGDVCSHAEAYLHEGEVDADFETIECPRHGSTFDLETGDPKSLPATQPVPVYDLKVQDEKITLTIPDRGDPHG